MGGSYQHGRISWRCRGQEASLGMPRNTGNRLVAPAGQQGSVSRWRPDREEPWPEPIAFKSSKTDSNESTRWGLSVFTDQTMKSSIQLVKVARLQLVWKLCTLLPGTPCSTANIYSSIELETNWSKPRQGESLFDAVNIFWRMFVLSFAVQCLQC